MQQTHEFHKASYFSRFFFNWVTPKVMKGHLRGLKKEDVMDMPHEYGVEFNEKRLTKTWLEVDKSSQNAFMMAFIKTFKTELILSFFFSVIQTVLDQLNPILLAALITFV